MQKIRALYAKHKELILYIVFGVLTTVVNMAVFQLMQYPGKLWLGKNSHWLSNPIAWIAAVAFAYVTNKLFVFEQKSWQPRLVAKEMSSFVAARLLTLGMEQALMELMYKPVQAKILPRFAELWSKLLRLPWFATPWSRWLHLPTDPENAYQFLTKLLLIQVLVMVLNYVFSKLVVFRKKKE